MSSVPAERRSDRLVGSLLAGFSATIVMVVVYLLGYAVAHLFAVTAPSATASHRLIASWLHALVTSPLTDPAQATFYVAVSLQLALGVGGALIYGAAMAPRVRTPAWLAGLLFGFIAWLAAMLVLLPAAGAGVFGAGVGAGPLPAYITLLAHLAYGVVLGLDQATRGGLVEIDGPLPSRMRVAEWGRCATGVVSGAIVGAAVGLALGLFGPWQGQLMSGGVAPVALMLAFTLVGGGMGELVGSFSALPTAATVAVAAVSAGAPLARTIAAPAPAVTALNGRALRVVGAHGACPLGYQPGQRFACSKSGQLEPGVCAAAQDALRPLICAMLEGRAEAPRQVACPIYDHMLVFELEPAA